MANYYQAYWSFIETNKVFLISVEIAVAVLLITFFNYIGRSWNDRRRSNMANKAGIVFVTNPKNLLAGSKIKRFGGTKVRKLKERQGISKDVALIGSTGFTTFVDPEGDLHRVIKKNCREAKVILLNPFGEGANIRAKSIPDPNVTSEGLKTQILRSMDYLRDLKALQKNIRLKLYQDAPLLKLAILGDYMSLKFYHAGLNSNEMPEYIFRHSQDNGSLYGIFYEIFICKWRYGSMPEYDFDTGELIYRDGSGKETRRDNFG